MNDKSIKKILVFMILGIVLVFIAPYLLTRPLGLLDFSKTGNIGDTIGGITAPITSLLGSILVFFALKAQIDANRIIQDQIESQRKEDISRKKVQYLSEQLNMVRRDINEFSYTYTENTGGFSSPNKQKFNYSGSDAINEFVESLQYTPVEYKNVIFIEIPKLTELFNLLIIIKALFDKIETAEISNEDKHFFKSLLDYQYSSKVRPAFTANEKHRIRNRKQENLNLDDPYGIPDKIFDLIDEIDKIFKASIQ